MENNRDIRSRTISGLIWRFAERCGAQGVAFIVSIVLARKLSPADYGMVALLNIFIALCQVFVDSGMGNALIQKKDADEIDFSSVFYFNIVICIIFYSLIYCISPYIAIFYGNSDMTVFFRVLGLTIIISAVKNVQQAYVSKHMMFKKFFFATIVGTGIAAIVGVAMAYAGMGVWALVTQQIVNLLIDTVILWITVRWRPIRSFSFKRLKDLFSFGWKMLASSLINTLYADLRQLIIGKVYLSTDLAYYNRGKQFPNFVVTNLNSSIDSVLFPVMSEEQDNINRVRLMTRRAIKTSSYIMWPMMFGLIVVSEPLTRLLLTEKWLPSVPFLRIFCLIFAFEPIQTANLNAIKALGRSDLFLKMEIIKKSIGLMILIFTVRLGVLAMAASLLLYSLVAQYINSFPNKKLLRYSYFEQLKDIFPAIGLGGVMALLVYPISLLNISDISILLLQVIVGAFVYIVGSILLKIESFHYILDILRNSVRD